MMLLTKYSRQIQNAGLVVLLFLLTLVVLAQANPILKLPSRDNGTYLYVGDQILKGKIPYKDVWEQKPPGIFYVDALGLWLGRGSRLGVWLIEFLTIFLAALFGYILLRRLWGNQAALFGTLIWFYALNLTLEGGNLTEEYSLPFAYLAILVFLYGLDKPNKRFPDLLIGILFAISFLFRPNNAIVQTALVLTVIILHLIQRSYRLLILRLAVMAIGLLVVILIPVLYFWSKDLLLEFYNAAIAFNLTYSNTTIVGNANPIRNAFIIFKASVWVFLFGFTLSCVYLIREIQTKKVIPPIHLFLLVGFLAVIPATDPARRSYSHYYMNWLPFIGLSSGFLYYAIQTALERRISIFKNNEVRDNLVALLLTVFILIISRAGTNYLRTLEQLANNDDLKSGRRSIISRYVNSHTDPGELVFFWGGYPGENFMSRRDSPTPYLYYPLYLESNLSDEINDAFLHDLVSRSPIMLVDMGYQRALSFDPDTRAAQLASGVDYSYLPQNLDQVYDLIEKNYYLEDEIDGKKVYRLNGTKSE